MKDWKTNFYRLCMSETVSHKPPSLFKAKRSFSHEFSLGVSNFFEKYSNNVCEGLNSMFNQEKLDMFSKGVFKSIFIYLIGDSTEKQFSYFGNNDFGCSFCDNGLDINCLEQGFSTEFVCVEGDGWIGLDVEGENGLFLFKFMFLASDEESNNMEVMKIKRMMCRDCREVVRTLGGNL